MKTSIEDRRIEWLRNGERGVSSETIHDFFAHRGEIHKAGYPHDSADFGRCYKLLELIPEWRARIHELGNIRGLTGQVWAALAKEWDVLEKRYHDGDLTTVNALMKKIVVPIEDKSGQVVRLAGGVSLTVPPVDPEHLKRAVDITNKIADIAEKTGLTPMQVHDRAMAQLNQKKEETMSETKTEDRDDELYAEAVKLVQEHGKASTSFIQRHLQIGYNRSANIMEQMEKNGIVTAANAVGKRGVIGFDTEATTSAIEAEETRVKTEKANNPQLSMAGDNSDDTSDVGGVSGKRLKSFLDRVERLEEEKKGLADDIKMVYAEAKGVGFDTKTMRKILKLRKMEVEKRREEEELLELYKAAIGLE